MKLSQMTNDQAAEALIELSIPIGNICDDDEFTKVIDEYKAIKDIPVIQAIGKILPKVLVALLRTHKADVYQIIGILNGCPASKIAKMNFAETLKLVRDSYDEVIHGFFISSMPQAASETAEG